MATELLVPPTMEPMSLDEAKDHLRVDQETDDAYITGLVIAARQLVESDTRRALLTQTWQLTLDDQWPDEEIWKRIRNRNISAYYDSSVRQPIRPRKLIVLPRPPVQSVVSINYLSSDGTFSNLTLDPSQYVLKKLETGEFGIRPAPGVTWNLLPNEPDAATVVVKCGYGDNSGSIPEPLRIAMLLLIAQWYDQRMPLNLVVRGTVEELPNATAALIMRHRIFY